MVMVMLILVSFYRFRRSAHITRKVAGTLFEDVTISDQRKMAT